MSSPEITPTPPAEKASLVEDFIDIFHAPSSVFERRRNSSAWLPLIVVTIVLAIGFLASSGAMQPIMDAEFDRVKAQMEANPQMSPEAMEKGRAVAEVGTKFAALIGVPIAIFIGGLLLWVSSKLVDAKQALGASVMITAWAWMPKIIGTILNAIQLQFVEVTSVDGMARLSIGPARFLDPDTASPFVMALAARFDVFVLWTLVLMAIGLSVVARIPRRSGWIAAGVVWLLGTLPALYRAL